MNRKEQKFVETVWEYYRRHGRRSLPWRRTKNPYRILVSEIMLQQTQVERVVPKYKSFLKKFPSFESLAQASLGDVLREWQGLGYNRRAKMLHECAKVIIQKCRGLTPKSHEELVLLPGVGRYTAGAILAFAYNTPIAIIETNIRSVYLHHFFHAEEGVSDTDIGTLVARTLDRNNPREWYYALMDYGVYIKKEFGNPNRRSKHHIPQAIFKGSDREIRGAIVRVLSKGTLSLSKLVQSLSFERARITEQIGALQREGIVVKEEGEYRLP